MKDMKKRGPLTESTYYILLALQEPNHGYGMMQMIELITEGEVEIGPGTLYGALGKLEKQGAIQTATCPDSSDERRKCYVLTDEGHKLLADEYQRMKRVVAISDEWVKEDVK
jgi:DNA-binding PadR family transcriptional regulator